MVSLSGVILECAAAFSVLKQDSEEDADIPYSTLSLFKMFLGMYVITEYEQFRQSPVVLICILFFLVLSTVFLLNLLVALLTCAWAYTSIYVDIG